MRFCVLPAIAIGAIALAIAGNCISGKDRFEATDPQIGNLNGLLTLRGQPFSGVLIKRNLRHDLLSESHYSRGELNGPTFTYHHDGVLVLKSEFKHGRKDGRQEAWYVDGKLRSIGYFRDGVAEGAYTEWHPNGKIYRQQIIENGVELENKIYYESGVIYSNYVVKQDRTFGIRGEPLCSAVKQEGFK